MVLYSHRTVSLLTYELRYAECEGDFPCSVRRATTSCWPSPREVGASIRQHESAVDSGELVLEVQEQPQQCINRA